MPQINLNKGYQQIPLRVQLSKDIEIPDNWLDKLADLIEQYLDLKAEQKQEISDLLDNLNCHAGHDSAYPLKDQLHESLKIIYQTFLDPAISADQKITLALKLQEGLPNCTPGFHNRANELAISFFEPENLNELLASMRQAIVSKAAAATTGEVHSYNQFFVIALNMGYGVRPLNPDDGYIGNIPVNTIQNKLADAFVREYTFFSVLNFLREQLTEILRKKGYLGRFTNGYGFTDYQKFSDTLMKFLTVPDAFDQLFILDEDGKIIDINIHWPEALIKLLIKEKYFLLSEAEEKQIDSLLNLNDKSIPDEFLSLFQGTEDFVSALSFFKEWPVERKANLFLFYLQNNSQQNKDLFLEKIESYSELFMGLQSVAEIQNIYLTKAVQENNLNKIKKLANNGADINLVLDSLIAQRDDGFVDWLVENPEIRLEINENYLPAIDKMLQEYQEEVEACPVMIGKKPFAEWNFNLEEKNESPSRRHRFFVEQISKNDFLKLAKEFLQSVVYGEQENAEKILQNNHNLLEELLTTKIKVKDYSGRKIYGTALQIAMGAKDVGYQPGEECMVEMLQKHLKRLSNGEKIIAEQVAEQFPEGFEKQEKTRIKRDKKELDKIIKAIAESKYTFYREQNWDESLKLAFENFRNYLKPKGVIRTGYHFNEQLFLDAYELYNKKYNNFDGWDSPRNNTSWRKVIGGIQRLLPANLGQAFCTGLRDIVDEGKCVRRLLKLRDGGAFYPVSLSSRTGLGFDFAIHSYWAGVALERVRLSGRGWVDRGAEAVKLVSNKNKKLGDLMPPRRLPRSSRKSGCAMS